MKTSLFLAFIFSVVACTKKVEPPPKTWWEPVDASTAKSWEILPQSVSQKDNKVILSKRNELGLLSNFADTPFEFEGKKYKSVEGFWQMMKFPEKTDPRNDLKVEWKWTRDEVSQMGGFEAKKAGSHASKIMKDNNIIWVSYKGVKLVYRDKGYSPFYQIIRRAMIAKLKQNPKVKEVLLRTGKLELLPDHKQGPDLPKAWRYYEIWMELRGRLQKGQKL